MYQNVLNVCKIFNEVQRGKKYHFGGKCRLETYIKIYLEV